MLILICGLPRAGKTTFSKKFLINPKNKVIHLDECMTIFNTIRQVVKNVEKYKNIIVEGIYHSFYERKEILEKYKKIKQEKCICIWLNTSIELKQTRPGYYKASDGIPFNPPSLEEGWDKIIIIKDNDYHHPKIITK